MNKNLHLTLDERKIIQVGIENRFRKVDIARTLGKDSSTIAKEIKLHRKLSPRNIFNFSVPCIFLKQCYGCKGKCFK